MSTLVATAFRSNLFRRHGSLTKVRVESFMRQVELAAFISDTNLYIDLPFHLHGGTSLHLHISAFAITVASRHREYAMTGNPPPIYCCEEPLPKQKVCTAYCPFPARQGKSGRCVTPTYPPWRAFFWNRASHGNLFGIPTMTSGSSLLHESS
jgi:hypothetical protein